MGIEIPNTQVECAGCDEALNVLAPHLHMKLRAQREALIVEEIASEDPNEVGDPDIYLGGKVGRGVVRVFHDFDCMMAWVKEREGLPAKLEFHSEDEIYVPEDNPDDEEIARRAKAAAKAAAEAEGDDN